MAGIDNLTASQLSNAAYVQKATYENFPDKVPAGTVPEGWSPDTSHSVAVGNNQFIVFVNDSTRQVVITFKGTDSIGQLVSDLKDDGAAQWAALAPGFADQLGQIRTAYAGYEVMTDGHSSGGGMSQTASLKYNLTGYGQNSLPIGQATIDGDPQLNGGQLAGAVEAWRQAGNKFNEVNEDGDIATSHYAGKTFLYTDETTTKLSGFYQTCVANFVGFPDEFGNQVMSGAGACAIQAHSILTVIQDLKAQAQGTLLNDPEAAQIMNANADAIAQKLIAADPIENLDGTIMFGADNITVKVDPSTGIVEVIQDGVLQLQQQVFDDASSLVKFYDNQNIHPYQELDISQTSTGKPTNVQMKVDGQPAAADFSGIGQVLGSTLGRALAPNNQFVQIAASTVLGVAGQKLAQVFLSSLSTNASKTVDFSTAFSDFGISVAGAGAGAVASFLISELGHELGLSGFQAQMFNTTVGGLASGVASKIATDLLNSGGTLSFAEAIGGLQWGDAVTGAIGNIGPNIASLLGSYLGHELVPAQTHAGAVGGQLLGAIGSVVGIALGNAIGGVLNFIIPGVGSLIGTILGTLLGDAFGSTPHPAAVDLVDQAGYLYGFTHYQTSASDGGDYSIPDPMAAATASIINGYLTAVKGAALDHSKQVTVGYVTDPSSLYINGVPGHTNSSFVGADDAVHAAALDVLQHTEVIGGDLLMKRAHQNSTANIPEAAPGGGGLPGQAEITGAEQLVTLGGDLNVAQDYENYLNNRTAINALISANPNTAFAAGWIATFARVNELHLNQYGASDFLGGVVGFLDSVAKAGLSFDAANVSVKQSGGSVTVEIRVGIGVNVPGTLSVFADQTNEINDATGKTVQFVFNDGLAAGGFHTLASSQTGGDGVNDIWFGDAGAANTFTGMGGSDILTGGAAGDTIRGGAGWDFIEGGAGNDVLYGDDGGDILHGGVGIDTLQGGAGNDTYAFNRGDGADTVYDDYRFLHTYTIGEIIAQTILYGHPLDPYEEQGDAGSDTLTLGTGIGAADVSAQISGNDLIIGVRDPASPNVPFAQLADKITLQNWTNPLNKIETLRLADGTVLNLANLAALNVPFGATLSSGGIVTENSAAGTVVGKVAGFDLDSTATLSYSLSNNAGGRFAINASTGVLTVANGSLLDYETATSHQITVQTADQGNHTFSKTFTIAVSNVDESSSTVLRDRNGNLAVSTRTADNGDITVSVYDETPASHLLNSGTLLRHTSPGIPGSGPGYQYTNFHNSSGVLNSQFGTYTSGAASGNTWINIYNSAGALVSAQDNDENGVTGYSLFKYYSSTGALVSGFGTYHNSSTLSGDTFSATYNANGTYATFTLNDTTGKNGSSYTNMYDSSGRLLSQNGTYASGGLLGDKFTTTYNANGTVATYTLNDITGQNGDSHTDYHNSHGLLISQSGTYSGAGIVGDTFTRTVNANGTVASYSIVDVDQQGYQKFTNQYDGNGNLLSQVGVQDDGTIWVNVSDGTAAASVVNWSVTLINPANSSTGSGADNTYTNYFNSSGQRIAQAGTWTSGASAGATWFDTFNASGGLVSHKFIDTAGNAGRNYIQFFDASGRLLSEAGSYDSGANAGNFWSKTFNADGTLASYTLNDKNESVGASTTTSYAHGILEAQNGTWTSGVNAGNTYTETWGPTNAVASFTHNDTANLYPWTNSKALYDRNGNLAVVTTAADNGDIAVSVYDETPAAHLLNSGTLLRTIASSSTGSGPGYQYTNFYDNSGVLNSQFGTYTSGAANGNTWINIYNSAGALLSSQDNDENGLTQYSLFKYYSSTGALVSGFGTYDHGSQLPGDTFSVTYNANGTYATYTLNDITGKSGDSHTDYHNSSGLLLSQSGKYSGAGIVGDTFTRTFNANGTVASYSIVDVDQQGYQNFTNQYDGNGNLLSQVGVQDDGTIWVNVSDGTAAASVVNWSVTLINPANSSTGSGTDNTFTNYFNGSGQRIAQAGTWTSGANSGATWFDTFNASGGIVSHKFIDTAGNAGRNYIQFFDASGHLLSEAGGYDSGANAGDFWSKTFNADGTLASYTLNDKNESAGASTTTSYAHGIQEIQNGAWTSGSSAGNTYTETWGPTGALASFTHNDTANLFSWTSSKLLYDRNGNLAVVTTAADNGDIAVSVYDETPAAHLLNTGTLLRTIASSSTGSGPGYQFTNFYDNSGVLNSQFGTYTSGAANGNTWINIYNSAGALLSSQDNDENGVTGYSLFKYYSSTGALVSGFGTFDSGSALSGDTFSVTYNANGTYATYTLNDITGKNGSSYTKIYGSSGQLLSQSGIYDNGGLAGDTFSATYNANGSYATYTLNDITGKNGSSYTNTYDIFGVLVSKSGTYDSGEFAGDTFSTAYYADGSYATTVNDIVGTKPWLVQVSAYDSNGALRTLTQNADSGSLTVTQYDVDGSHPWATYTSTFSNPGRLTGLNVVYDDSTSVTTSYEATDTAAWSSQTGAGGAGTQSFHTVDTGDAFEWDSYTNVLDSNGNLLSQAGTLDNGGHWLNAYDTAGTHTWLNYFNGYSPSGQLIWQSGTEDNGTHWLTTFDTSGSNSWSQATVAFDAEWNMMAVGGLNDDGSHLIAAGEFNQAYDTLVWSPSAYVPTQHFWPQAQLFGGTVAENAAANTFVGTVARTDGVLSFALVGSPGGPFAIDAATGDITVASGAQLDYETAPFRTITVRTTDATGATANQNFTIGVTNVNERPTGAALSNSSVMEHSHSGVVIGTLTGFDPDAGAVLNYTLTDPSGLFQISTNSLTHVSTLLTKDVWWHLNKADAASRSISVRVTDQAGLYTDQTLNIAITPDHTTVVNGGITTTTIYDAPELYYWNSFRTDRNTQGNVTYQLGINEGGSSWTNEYNGSGYMERMTVYNGATQKISQTTNNTDGTHTLVANDVSNFYSWRTFTMQFNSDWEFTSVTGINDNNSTNLDPGEVWSSFDTLLWYASPYSVELPTPPPNDGGGDGLPVVLDLDGNGIDITPLNRSSASFAMDDGPGRIRTAWAGANDGLLAIDLGANGASAPDGVINQKKEIVFTDWAPGSTSDMAALRQVFDTNHDGVLSSGDDRWSDFRIWQDANSDGISQAGEVRSLADRGVASIDLTPSGSMQFLSDGSKIQGISTYTRLDGSTGIAGDVGLAFDPGVRQVGSLAQLIQAMATHSADSGAYSPPTVQTSHEYSQAAIAPPH